MIVVIVNCVGCGSCASHWPAGGSIPGTVPSSDKGAQGVGTQTPETDPRGEPLAFCDAPLLPKEVRHHFVGLAVVYPQVHMQVAVESTQVSQVLHTLYHSGSECNVINSSSDMLFSSCTGNTVHCEAGGFTSVSKIFPGTEG